MDDEGARVSITSRLSEALASVRPLVTMSREDLVLVPLRWAVDVPPVYATAAAAAREGGLELREQGGGAVPSIEAVTRERPVVLFAGDTAEGGKQNRIINVTVWLAAMKVTSIPVSCLEHGRWNQGSAFSASRKVDYTMRSRMSRQMHDVAVLERAAAASAMPGHGDARRPDRSYAADQGDIWREISEKEARARTNSPTSALHDLYAAEAVDLAAIVGAFPPPAGATGLAVGIGGVLVACECFDASATCAEQWPRLVESAVSAWADHRRMVETGMAPKPRHRHPDEGALGRLLARAASACGSAIVDRSVGEGWDVRLAGHKVRGGALIVEGRPVHVELFRAED